jgi:hypothetical protein
MQRSPLLVDNYVVFLEPVITNPAEEVRCKLSEISSELEKDCSSHNNNATITILATRLPAK